MLEKKLTPKKVTFQQRGNSRNSGQRWVHRMDGCLDGLHPSNQKARGPCIGARCLTRGESATYQTSCRTPSLQNLEDEHKVSWVEEYQCSIFVPTALHGGTHRCTHTRYCTLHTLPHRPMRRRWLQRECADYWGGCLRWLRWLPRSRLRLSRMVTPYQGLSFPKMALQLLHHGECIKRSNFKIKTREKQKVQQFPESW